MVGLNNIVFGRYPPLSANNISRWPSTTKEDDSFLNLDLSVNKTMFLMSGLVGLVMDLIIKIWNSACKIKKMKYQSRFWLNLKCKTTFLKTVQRELSNFAIINWLLYFNIESTPKTQIEWQSALSYPNPKGKYMIINAVGINIFHFG